MSGSSALAALVAFGVALAGFAGVCITAPVGYPMDSLLENGLVREIVFDGGNYESTCVVSGVLVLFNPTGAEVGFDLVYPVYCSIYQGSELLEITGTGARGFSSRVVIPAGGRYEVTDFAFQATTPGVYVVEWGGMCREVDVAVGDLVPRIVTDKQTYRVDEEGYATFEYYNPQSYPVSFTPPYSVDFYTEYKGEASEMHRSVYISWIRSNFTIAPGESFRVFKFAFTAMDAGDFTLVINGMRKTVRVLPLSP